jgi:hypothetical protein
VIEASCGVIEDLVDVLVQVSHRQALEAQGASAPSGGWLVSQPQHSIAGERHRLMTTQQLRRLARQLQAGTVCSQALDCQKARSVCRLGGDSDNQLHPRHAFVIELDWRKATNFQLPRRSRHSRRLQHSRGCT